MEGFHYLQQLLLISRSMAILFGGKYPRRLHRPSNVLRQKL